MMANAAMTPAMKTPLMMLELASPEDGATEPQTSRPREFRTWLADSREAEPCGNPSGSSQGHYPEEDGTLSLIHI